MFGFCFLSEKILFFVNVSADKRSEIAFLLVVGLFFRAVNNVYSTLYLVVANKDRVVMNITLICSILGCFTLFFMVYRYGVVGGAINIAFVQIALGLASVFYYIKYSKL